MPASLWTACAWSQEADDEAKPAKPAAAKTEDKAAEPEAPIENPAVLAILETNPTTPDELLRAISILIDLKHPAAAKPLLQELLAAKLDDATLARLVATFGSATLLKIASSAPLAPQGNQFAEQASAAIVKHQEIRATLETGSRSGGRRSGATTCAHRRIFAWPMGPAWSF